MLITPAQFENAYNNINPRVYAKPEDMVGCVVLQPEHWNLIRATLDSLGYGATIRRMDAAIECNSRGACDL